MFAFLFVSFMHALCFDKTCICGGYGRVPQHSVPGRASARTRARVSIWQGSSQQ